MSEIDELLIKLKDKYESLIDSSSSRKDFIAHLKALLNSKKGSDYPNIKEVKFPKEIYIAYAVCVKDCGAKEFIVDGSTQECQYCGNIMFRTEVAKYKLYE